MQGCLFFILYIVESPYIWHQGGLWIHVGVIITPPLFIGGEERERKTKMDEALDELLECIESRAGMEEDEAFVRLLENDAEFKAILEGNASFDELLQSYIKRRNDENGSAASPAGCSPRDTVTTVDAQQRRLSQEITC
jgi:hypothetical protein